MAKVLHDDMLDLLLAGIANLGDTLLVLSGDPGTTYSNLAALTLADVALTEGDGNGDYVIGDGDASGRKLAVGAQAGVPIDATGTANHIALVDAVGEQILAVTECTSQALVSGGPTVGVPTWDIEAGDPT